MTALDIKHTFMTFSKTSLDKHATHQNSISRHRLLTTLFRHATANFEVNLLTVVIMELTVRTIRTQAEFRGAQPINISDRHRLGIDHNTSTRE